MKTTIKEIAKIQTGLFAKPVGYGDVVYLQSKHFDEYGLLNSSLHPDLNADDISENHLLNDGDVLFAAKGTKNFAAVYETHNPPAVASTSFFVLRLCNADVLPHYIAWFLNNSQSQILIKDLARGTSIPSIRKSVLEDLEIVIPLKPIQQIIVDIAILAKKERELREKLINKRSQFTEQKLLEKLKNTI